MRAVAGLVLAVALAGCVSDQAPPRSAAASPGEGYTVKRGDTLSDIAQRNGLQLSALARANRIAAPYTIHIGQRLVIPRATRPSTAAGSTSRAVVQPLPTPAPAPLPPQNSGRAPNPAFPASIAGAPRLVWPVDGPVAAAFGQGADPRGIAFSAHPGVAVRAGAGGTVLFAGTEPQRFGRLVLIDHGGGWVSAYGNLARLVVGQGEAVRAGARIGFTSERGLHFELRRDNVPVDPLPQMPPRF